MSALLIVSTMVIYGSYLGLMGGSTFLCSGVLDWIGFFGLECEIGLSGVIVRWDCCDLSAKLIWGDPFFMCLLFGIFSESREALLQIWVS